MIENTSDFKQAMRRLASTIALITAGRDEQRTGMAATAVMSVTASPPTLLIAVNQSASLHPVVVADEVFCVNLLGPRHSALVPLFSGMLKGSERFAHGDWRTSKYGPPILEDAVASLVCTLSNTLEVGTHTIFVGKVVEITNHPQIDPLLWVDGDIAATQRVSAGL